MQTQTAQRTTTPELKTAPTAQLPAAIAERGITPETYNVLTKMIFPGAKDPAIIALAWDYCKARELDILKKPCHIVPAYNAKTGRMEETVWSSIHEIRTTASRTGLYAGKDKPVYGETIKKTFEPTKKEKNYKDNTGKWQKEACESITLEYPEKCEITVYKIVGGIRCPFTSEVYWEELATFTNGQPNTMWRRRIHGQLAKCAEADALRAAFPEQLGGLLAAEEMEGRTINDLNEVDTVKTTKKPSGFAGRALKEAAPADDAPEAEDAPEGLENAPQDAEFEEVPQTPKEEEVWKGVINTNRGTQLHMKSESIVNEALLTISDLIKAEKNKDARLDIINLNLSFIRALAAEKRMGDIEGLHKLAGEGE